MLLGILTWFAALIAMAGYLNKYGLISWFSQTVVKAGLALAFDRLLYEASGAIFEEGAPLIHSLLTGVVNHLPDVVPENEEINRMRTVANIRCCK